LRAGTIYARGLLFCATKRTGEPFCRTCRLGGSPHNKVLRRCNNPPWGSATQRKPAYFRDHATPYEFLPLPHSPTPPPMRRIARPPTPQLSSRFDSRATHARTLLPVALASVPFGFVLVRVRVRLRARASRLGGFTRPFSRVIVSPAAWAASALCHHGRSGDQPFPLVPNPNGVLVCAAHR
jgi:hypothetical protein